MACPLSGRLQRVSTGESGPSALAGEITSDDMGRASFDAYEPGGHALVAESGGTSCSA